MRKLTIEQAQARMPSHLTLITWDGNKKPCTVLCTTHNTRYTAYGETASQSHGCSQCTKAGFAQTKGINWLSTHLASLKRRFGTKLTFIGPYKGDRTATTYRCSVHGEFDTKPCMAASRKYPCPMCTSEAAAAKNTLTDKQWRASFTLGDRLVIGKYVNQKTKIAWRCTEHRTSGLAFPDTLRKGNNYVCAECLSEHRRATRRSHDTFVRQLAKKNPTITAVSQFTGIAKRLTVKHECGHVWDVVADSLLRGVGCPKCGAGARISNVEQELFEFIKSLCADARQSDRRLISPQELDVVVPSQKLAFELNGLYWHNSSKVGWRYHRDKTIAVAETGYRLIHIYEDDWYTRNSAVRNLIANALGRTSAVRYARKLRIVETTDLAKVKNFLERHHIQGAPKSLRVAYGLFDGTKCTAVMCFDRSVSNRGSVTENDVWELTRYASDGSVVGGASRLFKHFLRNNAVQSCTSYSANDWFTGNMYQMLGFTLESELVPDYKVILGKTRRHKSTVRRSRLAKLLGDAFDPDKTELENCTDNGIYRIYDSGKRRWRWRWRS